MTKRLDIWLVSVLCLLMASTVSSCVCDDEPDAPTPEQPQPGDMVSFKFKIYTDKAAQRSRALGVWEEAEATVAERILNPDDMRVIILDAAGNLIRSIKPSVLEYNAGISGDGYYDLTVSFEDTNLSSYNDNTRFVFRVMILANINSLGGMYLSDALLTGANISDIQETFVMSPDWYPTETNGIPMYGLTQPFEVSKSQLKDSDGVVLGEINMLRAMSKIEVFDKVINTYVGSDGLSYPRVTGVELTSWRNHGYIRMEDPYADYQNGLRQAFVHPDGLTTVSARFMDTDGDGNGVFRAYCPEARLDETTVRVKAVLEPGGDEKTYDVSLGQYADDGTVFGSDLVRNHIYRFNVNSFGVTADIDVEVLPWNHQIDEYNLDNVVSMEDGGYLDWSWSASSVNDFVVSTTTYNGKQEQMLSMLNSTENYATGKFTIATPKGAVWRAYFVPGENGVDAFEFVDVDLIGNVVAGSARGYVEGNVGELATIHIRGKGPADAYRHYAELVVEVHTADGQVIPAWLTPQPNQSTRFIIYRENRL